MKTKSKTGLKIKSALKGGGFGTNNHSRTGLKIKSALKGGGFGTNNHSGPGLKVRTAVRAGDCLSQKNHSGRLLFCEWLRR